MFLSGYNHIRGRSQVLEREFKDIRYSICISTSTSDVMWSLRKPPWRTNVRNYEYLYKLRQFWPNLVQYVTAVSIRFDDNNFQNILYSRKKKTWNWKFKIFGNKLVKFGKTINNLQRILQACITVLFFYMNSCPIQFEMVAPSWT